MFDDTWSDPAYAANVLKSFLLDLPNAFLSEDMYDAFIELACKYYINNLSFNFIESYNNL